MQSSHLTSWNQVKLLDQRGVEGGGEIILSFCVIISIKSPKNEIAVEGFGGGSESWGGHLKSLRLPKYIHNLILQTKKSS